MGEDLIVKDNFLINASYNLELTEQRLILLAIVRARETGTGIKENSRLHIHASDYASQFHVSKEASYMALKDAVENLFNRYFSYKEQDVNNKEFVIKSRWVSEIGYADNHGEVRIIFSPTVVTLITRLEKHFTSYQMQQISNLSSKYAIRLYELIIAWRETGKVPQIGLSDFRERLGIEVDEYKQMGHFKGRVLDSAIKQINEHTDINVTYEQHKQGRVITGFSFKFKQKNKPKNEKQLIDKDTNTIDMFYRMTEAEINSFGNQLSKLPELAYLANGNESYEALASRIKDMLIDENKQLELMPHLKKLGFKTRKNRYK